jgi:hypothetical protein
MNDNSFFSIDRLVEFGMGLAVARQMASTMNESMSRMYVPGAMNPMQSPIQSVYYAMIEGKQAGPFSESELSRLISEKKVVNETYIWKPGLAKWEIAEQLPEVLKLVALSPPPFSQISQNN